MLHLLEPVVPEYMLHLLEPVVPGPQRTPRTPKEPMSRIAICLRLTLLGAFALGAFALDAGAFGQPALAQALVKVRIGKPQAATFPFVPVEVGIATGIFKKHGLEVESIDFAGGPRVQQAITPNALDIRIGSGPEMAFPPQGLPEIA